MFHIPQDFVLYHGLSLIDTIMGHGKPQLEGLAHRHGEPFLHGWTMNDTYTHCHKPSCEWITVSDLHSLPQSTIPKLLPNPELSGIGVSILLFGIWWDFDFGAQDQLFILRDMDRRHYN